MRNVGLKREIKGTGAGMILMVVWISKPRDTGPNHYVLLYS